MAAKHIEWINRHKYNLYQEEIEMVEMRDGKKVLVTPVSADDLKDIHIGDIGRPRDPRGCTKQRDPPRRSHYPPSGG